MQNMGDLKCRICGTTTEDEYNVCEICGITYCADCGTLTEEGELCRDCLMCE